MTKPEPSREAEKGAVANGLVAVLGDGEVGRAHHHHSRLVLSDALDLRATYLDKHIYNEWGVEHTLISV